MVSSELNYPLLDGENKSEIVIIAETPSSSQSGEMNETGSAPIKLKTPLSEVRVPLMKDTTLEDIMVYVRMFLHSPLHVAMLFWVFLATIATVILFMVQLGLLNFIQIFQSSDVRDEWIEVMNQIIMALFVLMVLVFHPNFIRHSYLLYRWSPKDIEALREEFCKGGTPKPDERKNILIVNIWAQLTCFGTYFLAVVYWMVPSQSRSQPAIFITLVVLNIIAWVSPAMALLNMVYGPLGRDYDVEFENPGANITRNKVNSAMKKKYRLIQRCSTFTDHDHEDFIPEWQGTIFPGCCSNPKVAILTCLFPFCVFGSNMQRLGFGHSWVQGITFVLMIFGPMLVFQLSAETLRFDFITHQMIAATGVVLAILGLAYGSAWRIRMREQFKLPSYTCCFGNARMTDVVTWIACPCCALCQEVRTAEYYDIKYIKDHSYDFSPFDQLEESSTASTTDNMNPPIPPVISS